MELQLVNLTKEFGNFRAVNNLNLTISNGVYGLLGVNGAGKTTLMKMICSLLTPTSGKILCDGQDIGGMGGEYRNTFRIFAAGIWILSGIYGKGLSLYIAALKGIRPIVAKKKVNKLLAQVGLSKAANKKMRKLSGGMKRRAGIDTSDTE